MPGSRSSSSRSLETAKPWLAWTQTRLDLGGQFLRQIFQLRAEASLHALSGPDQLFAEGRQPCALAAMGFDQRYAKEIGPLLDQIPDVPI
jgi:hypothetical protein